MKRYYIDVLNKSQLGAVHYDACSKPHTDAEVVARRMGFEPVIFHSSKLRKLGEPIWKKVLLHAYNEYHRFKLLRETQHALKDIRDSVVFIQSGFTADNLPGTMKMLRRNGNKVIVLVHDLVSLRENKFWRLERNIVRNIDVMIVHSEAMATFLRNELGYKGRIEQLGFFDYHNTYVPSDINTSGDINIVYAGNLTKSVFIKELHKIEQHPDMHFFLYGITDNSFTTNDSVQYKGKFLADDIAGIEGNWGLVWDGLSIDTCNGNYGEYLKYNCPFKFSLTIAAGLPAIVWKESAMAYYVEKYNLGITVASLHEVYDKIKALSSSEQQTIRQNVLAFSEKVRSGMMLEAALKKAL